ncbi:MAG: DNA-directed RNA polymerase subunit alpha [Candidatus Kerfeldbacteria bacterium]|nr:DNA-directed RNA polymerase subunit alpha [Candidatus Kerfeldbacteria bacterium]
MQSIPLPAKCVVNEDGSDHATVVVEPLYPGYGATLGNALRRVLLSSLPGAAVTAVKIANVFHEFSTLPHVKEDIVAILLNIKRLRFKLRGDEPLVATLKAKGEKTVTGADLKLPTNLELINTDQPLATLTDKAAAFELELTVNAGRGYIPVENREKERWDIGTIAVDAVYTPMRNVNFEVEHVRVEQMTNYDRLILDVRTDGTMSPAEAMRIAGGILVEHFQFVTNSLPETGVEEKAPAKPVKKKPTKKTEGANEETSE